jgi:predicted transcriptional regulator YheO
MDTKSLETLKRIAKGIAGVFGNRCEVVIHDFTDITQSVIHIAGNVTNRQVGAPITSTLARMVDEFGDEVPDRVAYKITTEEGKVLRCASIFLRDEAGRLEGCLAINFDVSDFMFFQQAFSDFTFLSVTNCSGPDEESLVQFSKKPSASMESIIDTTIAQEGKLPAMMDKKQKKAIVRKLDKAGVFAVKGSVNYLARALGASRYTIYNYLKEVRRN